MDNVPVRSRDIVERLSALEKEFPRLEIARVKPKKIPIYETV